MKFKKSKKEAVPKHAVLMIVISFLVICILLFFVKPRLETIPDNFYYGAEIFSLDNFYDTELGDFSGEQISKTKFSYETIAKKSDVSMIKVLFDVRQITGDKIFTVERLYGINRKTGEHVLGYGNRDRNGYLFAPKGLKKGENYTYWHINYNSPAYMKFQGEEELYGLKVYRYMADYHADQTKRLLHLPLVGKERGVELDTNLQIWIEPVTGRLIKYEDHAIAYYYNILTGERLLPWNKFSNRYREESVMEQVSIAKNQKIKINLVGRIIPVILVFCNVILFIFLFRSRNKKNSKEMKFNAKKVKKPSKNFRYATFIFLAALIFIFVFYIAYYFQDDKIKIIGISQISSNSEFLKNIEGFKAGLAEKSYIEGKNVKFIIEDSEGNVDKHLTNIGGFVKSDIIIKKISPSFKMEQMLPTKFLF